MTGTIALRLHMLSDWHIGTGNAAHGYIDRLVQRDQDGLPHVPAKTLAGVWRDACELAAHALDSGPAGVWHVWVEDLFGSQHQLAQGPRPGASRPARLVIDGALRMPGRVGEVLRGRPLVRQAVTFHKVGVAIDPETGAAAEDLLRVEEMARAGVELRGTAEVRELSRLDPAQQEAAVALLRSGARLLESIGGRRRRGAGRCRLELAGDLPAGLAVLERTPPGPPPHRYADVPAVPTPAAGPGWEQATLILRTRTPVIAYSHTQGNLLRARDHLPGWALLPAVLHKLGGQAAALARRGDLVVTAAMPGPPVPRVFATAKNDPSTLVANLLVEETAQTSKPARRGYLDSTAADPPRVRLPEMVVRMHNTIRDDVQRPTEDIGGVYIYSALAAGQEFRAQVRVRSGVLPAGWARSLAGTWRVGRSTKDDYGRVDIVLAEAGPVDMAQDERGADGDLLHVWLQSDLLVRDARLRPSTATDDVARALERALASAGAADVALEPVRDGRAAVGVGRVDSWHRRWGLPRPTLVGLSAGSCLTFRLTHGTVPAATLRQVETAGIGERTAEGFGQILINHPLLLRPITQTPPSGRTAPSSSAAAPEAGPREDMAEPLAPSELGHEEMRLFERAAWRTAIRRAAETIAADPERRRQVIPAGPTTTQLNAVLRLLPELDSEHRTARLDRLTWPEQARDQLKPLLADAEAVWKRLQLPETELTATRVGRAALRQELWHEAVTTLLTACLSAHAREAATSGEEQPA